VSGSWIVVVLLLCSALTAGAQKDTSRTAATSPPKDSATTDSVFAPRSATEAEAVGLKLLGLYDASDGHWISGAAIRDTLGTETSTSSIGVAVLNVLRPIAGYYLVEIRKAGYAPRSIRFRMDTTSEIMLALAPNPLGSGTTLPTVVVTAKRRLAEDAGQKAGFIYRCETGLVSCVGRAELDRHPGGGLDALLSHVDGVKRLCGTPHVRPTFSTAPGSYDPSTACHVEMTPSAGGQSQCTPTFFLNGFEWDSLGGDPQAQLDQFLNHSNIDGIEVYLPLAPVPARFAAPPFNDCGTIVIWTR
jgi:hypothetical protein